MAFCQTHPSLGRFKPGQARKTAGHNTAGMCSSEPDNHYLFMAVMHVFSSLWREVVSPEDTTDKVGCEIILLFCLINKEDKTNSLVNFRAAFEEQVKLSQAVPTITVLMLS